MATDPHMLIRIAANVAELKRNLAEGKLSIETTSAAMGKLAASLDGSKLEQRAHNITAAINKVGGATKLTDDEAARHLKTLDLWIEKGTRMGREIPPAILSTRDALKQVNDAAQKTPSTFESISGGAMKMAGAMGIAFSVGAVKSWVQSTLAAAGQIEDLSKKMGVSAEAVQRWQYAAEQGGATIEDVDKAVTVMNRSLAEGDKGTVAALRMAGLSFENIRKMKPEDAFNAITGAIEKIEDPMQRARVAVELFGKGGAELLPAIVDGFQRVGAGADVMADDTVARLAAAEDAWGRLGTKATIVSGEILAATMDVISRGTSSWKGFLDMAAFAIPGNAGRAAANFAISGLGEGVPAAGAGKPGQDEQSRQAAVTAALEAAKAAAAEAAALGKAQKASEDYAAAVARLHEVVVPLTAAQRRSVEAWIEQGKATKDMATVLRVNERAVTDFKKEQEDLDKILEKGIGSVLGLGDSYKQMGVQVKLTDGIVSTWMVSLKEVNDYLGDLARVGTKMPMPELPPPPPASAWEKHFLGLSDASAEAARVNDEVWMLSLQRVSGYLGSLSRHFDNVFGDILSTAAEVAGAMSVMFDPTASTLDKVMAGIELAISLGKKFIALFKDEEHEKVNDLRDEFLSQFGTGDFVGFNALAAQLHELGAAGDALFQRLINAKKVEEFNAAMAAVQEALKGTAAGMEQIAAGAGFKTVDQLKAIAAEAVKLAKFMESSGRYSAEAVQQAWERANAALIASGDEAAIAAKHASDFVAQLKTELQGLQSSVDAEAWEEDMGSIEREQRARIDAIKAEVQAREAQIADETAAREDAAHQAADDLQRILGETEFVARLKFEYELPEGITVNGGSGLPGYATGTDGYENFGAGTPVMLHGWEKVTPLGQESPSSSGGGDGYMPASIEVDGEVMARVMVKVRKKHRLNR